MPEHRAGKVVTETDAEALYRDHACVTVFTPVSGKRVVCGICNCFYVSEDGLCVTCEVEAWHRMSFDKDDQLERDEAYHDEWCWIACPHDEPPAQEYGDA